MINRVVLVGRLTKDPELRRTQNDIAVASFTLAVNRPFARNSESDQQADFIQCVVWRRQAENVAQFVQKGSLVGVEGRIQTRNYDDQDGNRRYITEVVADSVQFLEPKGSNQGYQDNQHQSSSQERDYRPRREEPKPKDSSLSDIDIADDDLPF